MWFSNNDEVYIYYVYDLILMKRIYNSGS